MPGSREPGDQGQETTAYTTPPPAAHLSTSSRAAQTYTPYDEKESHHQSYPGGRRLSPSSVACSSGTLDTIDIEKQALENIIYEQSGGGRNSHRSSRHYHSSPRHSHAAASPRADSSRQDVRHIKQCYDVEDPVERESAMQLSDNSVKLLAFFIFALPLLSFILSIATLVITLVLALLHPVRLIFTRKRSFSAVVLSVLAPLINIHFEFIYASPVGPDELKLFSTISALAGACVLSIGISFWAAVLAVYWCFAVIIGNPDGLDGRSEGREMVLTTRTKWLGWLTMAVKEE